MKTNKEKRYEMNIRMNEQEYNMTRILKEQHAINISGAFKLFLKQMMEKFKNA